MCMTSFNTLFNRRITAFWVSLLLPASLYAQSDLPSVSLAQLTRPTGWQLVGSVSTGLDNPSLKTQPGSTVLVGTSTPLALITSTDDFRLRFDLLTTPGSDVVLTLPSGQAINLARSQDVQRLLKAPGLWQTVEVWYKAGTVKRPAVLEKLILNGVTVREGHVLTGTQSGPFTLAATTGNVAVRNVGSRIMMPRDVARWNGPINYTIYEGESGKRDELNGKKVLKQDTTSMINYEVAYGQPRRYSILFSGKLNALQSGDYQFELVNGGIAGLWIDGKEVIPASYHDLGQSSLAKATLTEGPHTVEVMFTRSWPRPGLGLFVSQAGTRSQPLHALASLPEPDPVGVISVQATAKPERIRSFVQMPGEKTKRTHSMSVGTPSGIHYTLDLNQMALLQAWKGDFANVTEMWYERGEPQLLSPMGATVLLPGQTALMTLANESTAWPDSVDDKTLQYKGLTVDKEGYPTIEYVLGGANVTDAIRPDGNSLVRTLTLSNAPNGTAYCRLAAGSTIEDLGKGLYAVNDRTYYVRIDPKAKVKLRQSQGKQELLMPIATKSEGTSVQYAIVF